jgi:hypothetical protein
MTECLVIFFGAFNLSHECGYIANRMNDVDNVWDRLTVPHDDSDGIVRAQRTGDLVACSFSPAP